MSKSYILKFALICLITFGLAACSDDEKSWEETITVASVKPIVDQSTTSFLGGDPFYFVKGLKGYGDASKWVMFYDPIEGFDYQEGYEYALRIKIEMIKNPPQDGSDRTYTLLQVLSKDEKSSENVPQ